MSSILTQGRDITNPVTALIATSGVSTGGMAAGIYAYKYTFRTRYGETMASIASAPVTTASGSVDLRTIPIYPNNEITARRIYRTAVGGAGPFRFIAEINDNITTTWGDLAPDSALGAVEPIANFASTVGHSEGWHKFSRQLSRSQGNITAAGLTQATASLIGDYEYVYVTVPVNFNGVRLPAINPNLVGLKVTINNISATNSLHVYPYEATTSINNGVLAAPYTILPSFSLELICNSPTVWFFASSLTSGVAGPPFGRAEGDLTGFYPGPALTETGVGEATYGSSVQIPVITFDLKGRATFATSVAASNIPGGVAGGDLAGFYPEPVLIGSGVVAGTYGSATQVPIIRVDLKGRVTLASTVALAVSGSANVSIGTGAGAAITTGANNTIIGPSAGITLTTGSNNIIIGNGAAASAVSASNEITLGDSAITRVRFAAPGAIPSYVDKAAADADITLPSGSLYKFTATGQLMIKL